uniref:Cytochrome b561 domain-containing protein n=1 Tax=candidate division WWE3 bacterium TaxID=2053526 RepID=A0A7C4XMM4_UNCKA
METKYLIITAGSVILIILTVQVLSGLRIIKANPKYHKWGGLIILTLAIIHAIIGASYLLK